MKEDKMQRTRELMDIIVYPIVQIFHGTAATYYR